MPQKIDKAREFLINEYIKALNEGKIPWAKGWESRNSRVRNGSTNKPYRGMNQLILNYVSDMKGYTDPRWYTYKQAKALGYQVRRGEKASPISFPTLYLNGKSLTFDQLDALPKEDRDQVVWGRRAHSVFNAAQIDGVPELEKTSVRDIHGSKLVEDIQKGLGTDLIHKGNEAYYRPIADLVVVPPKESFLSEEEYAATVLHELCHSTGHPSRLNRDLGGRFGSERYAREELRAEIASSFLMQSLQMPMPQSHIDNHKAYIQSWIEVLKNEPKELFKAISEAEDIEKYALEKGHIDIDKLLNSPEKESNKELLSEKAEATKQKRVVREDHER